MAVSLSEQVTLKRLVAACNDEIWYESVAGTLTEVTNATDVDTSDMLIMFEAFQKVYIVNGTILRVADFVNTKLDLGAGNELTTAPAKGDILTQATTAATMVVDSVDDTKRYIYGYTTSGTFGTSNTVSSDDSGATMDPATFTPSVVSQATTMPHWYAWTKHPGKTTAMPPKAYIGCLYRGRCCLSGNPNDPHQWYMSRQNDPYDWDYTAGDAQSAVAGANANAGKIGDIVKAMIPYNDDYLIFGCASSVWVLQGDPAVGGSLKPISEKTGFFSSTAMTFDGEGNLWYFGTDGLNVIPNGFGSVKNVSNVALPNLIADEAANPSTHRITLGYDRKRNGILLSITTLATGANSCYWYDIRGGGFFPESYPNVCGAYSQFYYASNVTGNADLLVGCRDGYIRRFLDTAKDDDSGASDTAISSQFMYPAVPMGADEDREGLLSSLTFVLAGGASGSSFSDSDGVTYEIHVANDAETLAEAVTAGGTPLHTGTISGTGRKNRIRNRARGVYMGLLLKNTTASETFAMEKVVMETRSVGRKQ